MGERRRKDTKRKDIRAAICKLARWQRLGLRKALRETAVGWGGNQSETSPKQSTKSKN